MLAEQAAKFETAKKLLGTEIEVMQSTLDSLKNKVTALNKDKKTLAITIAEGERLLKVNNKAIEDGRRTVDDLTTDARKLRDGIMPLVDQKAALEVSISGLAGQESELKKSIGTLKIAHKDWQRRTANIESNYIAKVADKEAALKILDTKLLTVTQTLEERQHAEESTRDDLAKRQRILDERDRNLRIREAKVEQGENKLIQNSNLLNL